MELRQLRYFLKAGDLLNFTEAAKAVHISQSTLSQQIKQLEEELGTQLFDRIGKRVVLTEGGRLRDLLLQLESKLAYLTVRQTWTSSDKSHCTGSRPVFDWIDLVSV